MIRSSDWWEYKLPPMLAISYLIIDQTSYIIISSWLVFVIMLFSLITGAAYVSLLNDATDIKEDKLAGKKNHMAAFSGAKRICITLLPLVVAGCLIIGPMRRYPLAIGFYLIAYLCFTLYSLPPFRFKKRGILGVFADALGSQVFPMLFIMTFLMGKTGQSVAYEPLLIAGVWAFFFGLRGILWHQFSDLKNDTISGMKTIVGTLSNPQIRLIGRLILLVELLAFALIILYFRNVYVAIAIGIYALQTFMIRRNWQVVQIILRPTESRYRIFMFEFYQVYFPFAILIGHCFRQPIDILALGTAFILFYKNPTRVVNEIFTNLRLTFGGAKVSEKSLSQNIETK